MGGGGGCWERKLLINMVIYIKKKKRVINWIILGELLNILIYYMKIILF